MANVVTRRLFGRNILKLKDFTHCRSYNSCTGVFFINVELKNGLFYNEERPNLLGNNCRIQFYSKSCDWRKPNPCKNEEKPSLFQRFKQMYKDYWYVLVPVHLVTSAAWYGGFYYMAKSGVDIASILESWNFSEKITSTLKDSSMGYLAIAYAMYKIATPVRYTVTLGGTTISITYLKKWGYIKPVPSKERLKEMYFEQKSNLMDTVRETREELHKQSEKLKDKKENIIEDLDNGIKQIKELGEKIKSKEHVIEEVKKKKKKLNDKD